MIGQGEGPLEMPGASTEEMLQYKLTAAEEQLAAMQEALKLLIMSTLHCPDCGLIMEFPKRFGAYHLDGCIVAKALSAAPKRGRVVAEQRVTGHYRHWPLADQSDLMLYARSFVPSMYISVPHSEAEKQRKAEFAVTVREAE